MRNAVQNIRQHKNQVTFEHRFRVKNILKPDKMDVHRYKEKQIAWEMDFCKYTKQQIRCKFHVYDFDILQSMF